MPRKDNGEGNAVKFNFKVLTISENAGNTTAITARLVSGFGTKHDFVMAMNVFGFHPEIDDEFELTIEAIIPPLPPMSWIKELGKKLFKKEIEGRKINAVYTVLHKSAEYVVDPNSLKLCLTAKED